MAAVAGDPRRGRGAVIVQPRQIERPRQMLKQCPRAALRRRLVGIADQHHEFVAADPRRQLALGQRRAQPVGDHRQKQIAGLVAKRVVHRFELVQIEIHQRETLPRARGEADPVVDPLGQQAAVGKAGQLVELRHALVVGLGLAQKRQIGQHRHMAQIGARRIGQPGDPRPAGQLAVVLAVQRHLALPGALGARKNLAQPGVGLGHPGDDPARAGARRHQRIQPQPGIRPKGDAAHPFERRIDPQHPQLRIGDHDRIRGLLEHPVRQPFHLAGAQFLGDVAGAGKDADHRAVVVEDRAALGQQMCRARRAGLAILGPGRAQHRVFSDQRRAPRDHPGLQRVQMPGQLLVHELRPPPPLDLGGNAAKGLGIGLVGDHHPALGIGQRHRVDRAFDQQAQQFGIASRSPGVDRQQHQPPGRRLAPERVGRGDDMGVKAVPRPLGPSDPQPQRHRGRRRGGRRRGSVGRQEGRIQRLGQGPRLTARQHRPQHARTLDSAAIAQQRPRRCIRIDDAQRMGQLQHRHRQPAQQLPRPLHLPGRVVQRKLQRRRLFRAAHPQPVERRAQLGLRRRRVLRRGLRQRRFQRAQAHLDLGHRVVDRIRDLRTRPDDRRPGGRRIRCGG